MKPYHSTIENADVIIETVPTYQPKTTIPVERKFALMTTDWTADQFKALIVKLGYRGRRKNFGRDVLNGVSEQAISYWSRKSGTFKQAEAAQLDMIILQYVAPETYDAIQKIKVNLLA